MVTRFNLPALAAYSKRLLSWYRQLETRQQQMVVAATFLAAGMTLFFGLWQPIYNRMVSTEHYYNDQRELYRWVMENSAMIKANPQTQTASSETTTADIYKSAETFHLKIDQFATDKQNTMHLQLNNLSFSQLIQWLDNIEQQYSIRVRSLTITQSETSPSISASVDLYR